MWKYVNSSSETVSLSVVTVIESMEQVCSSCRTGPGAAPANTLCPTQRHTVSPQPLLQLLTPKTSLRQVWCPATFQLGFLLLWLLGTRNIHSPGVLNQVYSPGVLNQVYSPALSSDPSDMFSPLKEDFRFVAGCWGTGGFSSPSLSVCECSKEQSYTFCCWCPQPSWGRVGLCWGHVSVCVCDVCVSCLWVCLWVFAHCSCAGEHGGLVVGLCSFSLGRKVAGCFPLGQMESQHFWLRTSFLCWTRCGVRSLLISPRYELNQDFPMCFSCLAAILP